MKFNPAQHSFAHRQKRQGVRQIGREWRDLFGILVLSLGILSLGSFGIALASYQILKATEPSVEQVASPLAWDF